MEKALIKATSLKVGRSISKKAKEELSNITDDITVSQLIFLWVSLACISIF